MSSKCPCCSSSLLRHWKQNKMYWFCSHCRQEMPNIKALKQKSFYPTREKILTKPISLSDQLITFTSSKQEVINT